ncbi:MAG: hypothetical protein N3A72_04545 [bacterium]|nr:hypothetical protein [bacterium]
MASKFQEAKGKLRRLYLAHFQKQYVYTMLTKRQGQCQRCARCCQLLFRCPFLKDKQCIIYDKRFAPCRAFPIDYRDLADVDHLCGFKYNLVSKTP